MSLNLLNVIEEAAVEAIGRAVISIPPDVKEAIRRAYLEEESEVAKAQLKAILDNIELAERLQRPMCQDTGTMIFYVRVGHGFPAIHAVKEALVKAVRKATQAIPLRPNSVNPFTSTNTGDNTGRYIPYIHWDVVAGDELEFTVVPKGGGSEYPAVLRMIPPGRGVDTIKEVVLDAVLQAGAMPCPPTIVGVGVGGGADIAMTLAKKAASLRKVGTRNEDPALARLEEELHRLVNHLGIGVMGMGGRTTALAVHIEYAHRHPANYPVAVVFQCWATRRATATVKPDASYTITQ
ncbi:MAG: fumarate hydratase [Zestosphaera sp.]